MSKKVNIKFSGGIVNTPSDVSPIDGDLNECINLVPSDGELKPVEMPKQVFPNGGTAGIVAAVHSGVWGKNFVKVNENKNEIWFLDQNMQRISVIGFNSKIKWIQCLGLYVVVGTENSIEYVMFKNGVYTNMGQKPQSPHIDFDLQFKKVYTQQSPAPSITDLNGKDAPGMPISVGYYNNRVYLQVVCGSVVSTNPATYNLETGYDKILENIQSKIDKIVEDTKKDSAFIFPFFIRYALKLKTGEYISTSQPILVLPSSDKNPILFYYKSNGIYNSVVGRTYAAWNPEVAATSYSVHFKVDKNDVETLKIWDDIVEGVSLFITRPLYTHQESKMYGRYIYENLQNHSAIYAEEHNNINLGKSYNSIGETALLTKHTQNRKVTAAYTITVNTSGQQVTVNVDDEFGFDLPVYSADEQTANMLVDGAIFYHVKTWSLDELNNIAGSIKTLELSESVLTNLTSQLVLPENMHDDEQFSIECACVYNGRLIAANKTGNIQTYYKLNGLPSVEEIEFKFFLTIDGVNIIQHSKQNVNPHLFSSFLYHSYSECYKAYIKIGAKYYSCVMRPHPTLNGTYYYAGYMPFKNVNPNLDDYITEISAATWDQAVPTSLTYKNQNIIMVSDVASPLSFNVNNMLEVGHGSVLNIATNALPMSQGQFGQYPVAAFTDNGIFSLGINTDGSIGAVAPVSSADTLIGFPKLGKPNVISDGQSLYFITKRGLMELRGLQVRCVSEILNGRKWESKDYPCSVAVDGNLGIQNCITLLADGITDQQTFNQMIEDGDAFLAFDYKHNRILVTDPTRQSHYLYAISSGKWSKLIFGSDFDNFNPTNVSFINLVQHITTNPGNDRTSQQLSGRQIVSAVFDYNRSYLQMSDSSIYDLMGAPDENNDPMYKFGFVATRPMRFGTDDYKTLKNLLHRKRMDRAINPYSTAAIRLYGSVDGIKWYELRHLRGAAYKYYTVLLYTCMKANERYSYMSVEFEEKFQNKLR